MDDLINYIEHGLSTPGARGEEVDVYSFQDEFLGVHDSPPPICHHVGDSSGSRNVRHPDGEHIDYLELSPTALEDLLLPHGNGSDPFEWNQEEELKKCVTGDGPPVFPTLQDVEISGDLTSRDADTTGDGSSAGLTSQDVHGRTDQALLQKEESTPDELGFDLEGFTYPESPGQTKENVPVQKIHPSSVSSPEKTTTGSPRYTDIIPLSPSETTCHEYFHTTKVQSPRKPRRLLSPRASNEVKTPFSHSRDQVNTDHDTIDFINIKENEIWSPPAESTAEYEEGTDSVTSSLQNSLPPKPIHPVPVPEDTRRTGDNKTLSSFFCKELGREVSLYNYNDFPRDLQALILQQMKAGWQVIELPDPTQRAVAPTAIETKHNLKNVSQLEYKQNMGSEQVVTTRDETGVCQAHQAASLLQEAAMAAGLLDFEDDDNMTSYDASTVSGREEIYNHSVPLVPEKSQSQSGDSKFYKQTVSFPERDVLEEIRTEIITRKLPAEDESKQPIEGDGMQHLLENANKGSAPSQESVEVRHAIHKVQTVATHSADDTFNDEMWDDSVPPSSSSSSREDSIHNIIKVPPSKEHVQSPENAGFETLQYLNMMMGNEESKPMNKELGIPNAPTSFSNDNANVSVTQGSLNKSGIASGHNRETNQFHELNEGSYETDEYEMHHIESSLVKERSAEVCMEHEVSPVDTAVLDQSSYFGGGREDMPDGQTLLALMSSSNPHLPGLDTNPPYYPDELMPSYVQESVASGFESLDYLDRLISGTLDTPQDAVDEEQKTAATEPEHDCVKDCMDTIRESLSDDFSPSTEDVERRGTGGVGTNSVRSGHCASPAAASGQICSDDLFTVEHKGYMEALFHNTGGSIALSTSSGSEWSDVDSVSGPKSQEELKVKSISTKFMPGDVTVAEIEQPSAIDEGNTGDFLDELNKHLASFT